MSRKARICTVSMNSLFYRGHSSKEARFSEAEAKIKRGALDKPDLFLLPETFLVNDVPDCYSDPANIEEPGNETYRRLGRIARSSNAYLVAPLLTRKAGLVHNAAVVFDRQGDPVFDYYKTHPTPAELQQGVSPGPRDPDPFDADFGRIGLAICYDLNFQHLFHHYYDRSVELLLFSSYFPGGLLLQSWCHLYNFHAVSSHAQGDESVFIDNLGFEVARTDMFAQAVTHVFELDSVVVPFWGNHEQIAAAKDKYGPDLALDVHRPAGVAALRYLGAATTVRNVLAEFKIRTKSQVYDNQHLL